MQFQELVTDEDRFIALQNSCFVLFERDRRLPANVFRRNFADYVVFEYGQIMRKEFAGVLAELARTSHDRTVNYMTLDPDPVHYYKKHCGFFGLASFSADTIEDNYLRVMYRDGSVDSFRARGGDIGVLWGESLKWGIFCDRRSWEVCLLGLDIQLDESVKRELGSMSTSTLADYISTLYRDKEKVGQSFLTDFQRSYPSL